METISCPNWCDRDHSGRHFDEDDRDYAVNHHRTVIDHIIGEGSLSVRVAVLAPVEDPDNRQIEVAWANRDEDPDVLIEAIMFEIGELPQLLEALQHAGALAADPSIAGEPRAAG